MGWCDETACGCSPISEKHDSREPCVPRAQGLFVCTLAYKCVCVCLCVCVCAYVCMFLLVGCRGRGRQTSRTSLHLRLSWATRSLWASSMGSPSPLSHTAPSATSASACKYAFIAWETGGSEGGRRGGTKGQDRRESVCMYVCVCIYLVAVRVFMCELEHYTCVCVCVSMCVCSCVLRRDDSVWNVCA